MKPRQRDGTRILFAGLGKKGEEIAALRREDKFSKRVEAGGALKSGFVRTASGVPIYHYFYAPH
jgi:hypothetical protein